MDSLLKEIREHFAANKDGMRKLNSLPSNSTAYTIRIGIEFGVAIEFDVDKDYYEESSNSLMRTQSYILNGASKKFITLTCCDELYRNEFADLCGHFVDPGENNTIREQFLSNPLEWWSQWIGLLGDRKSSTRCYDVIAEMVALDSLYKIDPTIEWAASHTGSHDIESSTNSFEVKSTVKKSDSAVSISSQHQLSCNNELSLLFFRLERSLAGVSINDMKTLLVKHGYNDALLESQLEFRGFNKGSSLREIKYSVLEARQYLVDDSFPKIVAASFKNDVYPKNIIKILYTIDLEGLSYSNFDFSIQ